MANRKALLASCWHESQKELQLQYQLCRDGKVAKGGETFQYLGFHIYCRKGTLHMCTYGAKDARSDDQVGYDSKAGVQAEKKKMGQECMRPIASLALPQQGTWLALECSRL